MQSVLMKIKFSLVIIFTTLLFVFPHLSEASPLPAEKAFIFSANILKPDVAMVEWQITPGYYLYSKRMHFNAEKQALAAVQKPQGDFKYDPNLGRQEVFSKRVAVPLEFKQGTSQAEIKIDYQGCSEDGFCYPPMHKNLLIDFSNNTITPIDTIKTSALLSDQNHISDLFNSKPLALSLMIFLGLGLLLAFTPCCLPMIPILTGIIVGQNHSISAKKAFFLSLSYVLGSAITYAVAGLIAASMGASLQIYLQMPWMIAFVSGLFVFLAFSLFGWYELKLPNQLQNRLTGFSNRLHGGHYFAVFLMGMISTLIVSPCVTAPLVGVLMYIGQTGDQVLGASALFAMGLGMGLPLLLIGTSAGKYLPRSGPWMEAVKKTFGFLMLGMAIWLSTRISSPTVNLFFWGGLLIVSAIFIVSHLPRLIGFHRLSKVLGVLIGSLGLVLMLGASMPHKMPNWMMTSLQMNYHGPFTVIHNVSELNQQLALAQAAGKPVILDFYADWCASCVAMDRNVFAAAQVKQELSRYILLRADLTANNSNEQAIMKLFRVIAPPTILFFDPEGQELDAKRIIGEVNASEFIARLDNSK